MDEGWSFPLVGDGLAEVLLRLPVSARRRFRLVCRFWREVIDKRTPEMQSRPKTLAFGGDPGRTTVSAYVVDDLSSEGLSARKLWTGSTTGDDPHHPDVAMVGTCNGLLCLCDKSKPGEITLVNPVTGETLLAPSPLSIAGPCVKTMYDPKAFSFAYHPVTGQYKILHVPCRRFTDWGGDRFDVVYVLTLGDASWRAVLTPGASCDLSYGLISIDGTMFWITGGTKRVIMSLDLEHERLASTAKPLPLKNEIVLQLVEFHGRLGITTVDNTSAKNTQIWVSEDDGRWSRRYSVYVQGPTWQSVAQPHFEQDKYILMTEWSQRGCILYRHIPRDHKSLPWSVVVATKKVRGMAVADIVGHAMMTEWSQEGCILYRHIPRHKSLPWSLVVATMKVRGTAIIVGHAMRTFSYVETTEPLSCYAQE